MRQILMLFTLAVLVMAKAYATQPVSIVHGQPESRYDYTNGTLSLSSFTVTTVAATSGYRALIIPNVLANAATIYYRVDGSTQNIATTGFPILPATTEIIETNQTINLLLEPLLSAKTVRYLQRKK